MTQLYIDRLLCELPPDFSFTLVKENVYFSEASSYTFEVKLPIVGTINNQKIFGSLNRIDVKKRRKSYSCQLIVDNKVVINGTATVTSVDNTHVGVQLLGGNSELNFASNNGELYIDDLDLGTIDQFGIHLTDSENGIYSFDFTNNYEWTESRQKSRNFMLSPIENTTTGEVMNPLVFDLIYDELLSAEYMKYTQVYYGECSGNLSTLKIKRIAVQPKLSYIVEKIFDTIGYSIVHNDLDELELYNSVYVGNSSEVLDVATMLPHWTVSEFIDELKKLYCCVFVIDERTKRTSVYTRANFYGDEKNITYIQDCIDEFSVSIDEETTDEYAGSKGFDISYPDYKGDYLGEGFSFAAKDPNGALATNHTPNKIYERGLRRYVSDGETSFWVDTLRDYLVEGSDNVTKMKIVPVMPSKSGNKFQQFHQQTSFPRADVECDTLPSAPGLSSRYSSDFNLVEIIQNEESPEERERLDKLYIGLFNRAKSPFVAGGLNGLPLGSLVPSESQMERVQAGLLYGYWNSNKSKIFNNHYATSFNDKELTILPYVRETIDLVNQVVIETPIQNLYNEFYKGVTAISTNILYHLKFAFVGKIDPQSIFVIRNKRFVAKEIELSISDKGISKILQGKFYQLI